MNATSLAPEEELRRAGLRATDQRVAVLDILRRSGEHLDAGGIYIAARARDADVSLATVYRTVRALEEAGLVELRYFGPGHARDHYEAAGGPEHYHFTCARCGRVLEFETPAIRQLRADLRTRLGWRTTRTHLSLEGVCAECASVDAKAQDSANGGSSG